MINYSINTILCRFMGGVNVDFATVISMGAVLLYISKYCSKTGVKSEIYGQMLTAVLIRLDEGDAGKVAFENF